MKRKLLTVLGSIFTTGFLHAQHIQVTQSWQLYGATEDIDVSNFDNKCVDFVWKYNNGWKLHIANGKSYNMTNSIPGFNTINKGEGFWIKGNGNCEIDIADGSNFKFTKDWLTKQPLYDVFEDDGIWQIAKFTFTDTIMHGEMLNDSGNTIDIEYAITTEGYITAQKPKEWNEGEGNFTIAVVDKNDTAMKICWRDSEKIQNCINRGGDDEYFFVDYNKAKEFMEANNADIIANSEEVTISGKVTFKDENGNTIAVPNDARIIITSDSDQNNHKLENGFNVGINSDGTFSLTKKQYKNTYKQGHTFQVAVYKNYINTEENMWDCGEDVYRYVGNDVPFNGWQNIIVTPQDYQDRSNEICND